VIYSPWMQLEADGSHIHSLVFYIGEVSYVQLHMCAHTCLVFAYFANIVECKHVG